MGSSPLQDGYAFWGLKKAAERAASKKDPVESLQKAWDRYRERAEGLVKGASDESRPKLFEALNQHATTLMQLTGNVA